MKSSKNINILKIYLSLIFFVFSAALWRDDMVISQMMNGIKWILLIGLIPLSIIFNNNHRIILSSVSVLLYFFIVTIALSTLLSPYLNRSGIIYLFGYISLFLIAFIFQLGDRNIVNKLLYSSLKTAVTLCLLISITQFYNINGWENGRFRGIFDNTNYLGWTSALTLIYYFHLSFKSVKVIPLIILIISIFTLWIVQSRSAYVGVVIGLLLVTSFNYHKIKLSHLLVLLLSAIYFVFFSVSGGENIQRRDFIFALDKSRSDILVTHMKLFLDNPIIGVGLSESEFGGRFPAELAYTDILSFSGVIGFSLFISALIICSSNVINAKGMMERNNAIIFIMILVMSIGDGYISNIGNPLPIFAWIYMGTLARRRINE